MTLLNLPLELSTDSPAWTPERPTLFTGLADYVRRCKSYLSPVASFSCVRVCICVCVLFAMLCFACLPAAAAAAAAAGRCFLSLHRSHHHHYSQGQTFEGGISGKPDGEAHGAYAFCALGCLSILDTPHRIIPKYVSIPQPLLSLFLLLRRPHRRGQMSGSLHPLRSTEKVTWKRKRRKDKKTAHLA